MTSHSNDDAVIVSTERTKRAWRIQTLRDQAEAGIGVGSDPRGVRGIHVRVWERDSGDIDGGGDRGADAADGDEDPW